MSCGTTRDRVAQALLRHARNVLPVDQDAADLHVIETLQQREQRRLAGCPNGRPGRRARPASKLRLKSSKICWPSPIAELDLLELHAGAALDQRRRFRMIAQLVRHQQRRQSLREPRDVLRDIDQCDGKVARRMQHGKSERAGQHDVAGGRRAALPQHDRPGEQAERQNDGHDRVKDAQLLEIEQAALPRLISRSTVASKRRCSREKPPNARTSGILLMTSTISPSTAAALPAKS